MHAQIVKMERPKKKERKQDRYSGLSPFPRVVERKRHRKGQKRLP